ncbi:hypothetical protein J3A69_003445 [Pseudomonas putida]|nr:hypothetical protein [Pseudomonas sp. PvP089]MBP2223838.1 hypothetical protein [Pseudomonas putida]
MNYGPASRKTAQGNVTNAFKAARGSRLKPP